MTPEAARWAAHQKLPHWILLFCANRRPEDAAYLDELRGLARENPNFTFIPTMTRVKDSHLPWQGEVGYIGYERIEKYLQSSRQEPMRPIFYTARPAAMVAGLRAMLNQAGIDDDDIRSGEFTGHQASLAIHPRALLQRSHHADSQSTRTLGRKSQGRQGQGRVR
jgi:ferredoxin-NADP reductase